MNDKSGLIQHPEWPKVSLMDRRALPGLVAGLAGLAFGVSAAVLSSPALAVVAAACALAAGGASLVMLERVHRAEREAAESRRPVEPVLPVTLEDEAPGIPLLDSETGLPDRHFFELALDGRVAAARRHLWPVTVVLLDVGLQADADGDVDSRGRALATFAPLLRQPLREADIACRLSSTTMGLILEDTAEEGGVWTAQRLQIALAKDVTRVKRLAAGVASYPSHGLRPEEVLNRAEQALGRACAAEAGHGLGEVEVAHVEL
jgi:diguanylate cyclase (GGDEF)-like protein